MRVDELNEAKVLSYKEYGALIEKYKKQNPEKYETKKEVLKERLEAKKEKPKEKKK